VRDGTRRRAALCVLVVGKWLVARLTADIDQQAAFALRLQARLDRLRAWLYPDGIAR